MSNEKYKFAKSLSSDEEYYDMGNGLLDFAKKESSLDINAFPLSLTINPDDFITFRDQSEYFKKAYETSLRIIGARIKRLAFEGAIDRHIALELLPLYDPSYRSLLAEKKHGEGVGDGNTKVISVMLPCLCANSDSANLAKEK